MHSTAIAVIGILLSAVGVSFAGLAALLTRKRPTVRVVPTFDLCSTAMLWGGYFLFLVSLPLIVIEFIASRWG